MDLCQSVWGQLAALTAAAFWAVASILYHRAGAHFSPLQMNLIKGAIASPLLFGMSALFGAPLVFSAGLVTRPQRSNWYYRRRQLPFCRIAPFRAPGTPCYWNT